MVETTRVNGVKLITDGDMVVKSASNSEDGRFEGETFDWIHMKYIGVPYSVFFDIGAYTGIYSFAMANHYYLATCYAFEPNETVYNRLLENKDLQLDSRHRIHTFPYGLSSKNEVCNFYTNSGTILSSGGSVVESEKKDKKQTVHLYKLDDVVKNIELERIDLVKIDVEGYELHVLSGMRQTVDEFKPDIIVEFLSDTLADYAKHIKFPSMGYEFKACFDGRNYLFQSTDR